MTIEDDKAEAAFENSIDPNIDRIADLEAENQRLKSTVHGKCIRIAELETDCEAEHNEHCDALRRIAELEAENKRLRKQVDELIKQKRQLEADLRQL